MEPTTKPLKLLKQSEVAEIIRKSEAWLERKRWEGGGPRFMKIGRNVLYRESDLLVWLESQPCISSTSEFPREKGGGSGTNSTTRHS